MAIIFIPICPKQNQQIFFHLAPCIRSAAGWQLKNIHYQCHFFLFIPFVCCLFIFKLKLNSN